MCSNAVVPHFIFLVLIHAYLSTVFSLQTWKSQLRSQYPPCIYIGSVNFLICDFGLVFFSCFFCFYTFLIAKMRMTTAVPVFLIFSIFLFLSLSLSVVLAVYARMHLCICLISDSSSGSWKVFIAHFDRNTTKVLFQLIHTLSKTTDRVYSLFHQYCKNIWWYYHLIFYITVETVDVWNHFK